MCVMPSPFEGDHANEHTGCFLEPSDPGHVNVRSRLALDFAIEGDIRFLSHQDVLRLLARAVARARLPVRSSQGFNPRPQISMPLPRPVGLASDAERIIIESDQDDVQPEVWLRDLSAQMPDGITLKSAFRLNGLSGCVARRVRYRIERNGWGRQSLQDARDRLLRFAPADYNRYVHKRARHVRIDLRPYIDTIDVTDDAVLFTLHVTGGGSAKPAELCDLLGIGCDNINHLIRRLEIVWN